MHLAIKTKIKVLVSKASKTTTLLGNVSERASYSHCCQNVKTESK